MPSVVIEALANLLVKSRILTEDQVREVLNDEQEPNDTFDKVLLRRKLVARNTLLTLLMEHYKVPFVTLPAKIDIQILKLLPEHLVTAYEILPIGFEGQQLTLAMVNPAARQTIDRVAATTGLRVKPV